MRLSPRNHDHVQAYYQNVRGLRTKTSKFLLASTSCNYDVIALTETSLNSSFYDGELFDTSEFFVYRCDRSELNSVSEVGGGVLIAVKSDVNSELVVVPDIDGVELVVVRLRFDRADVFVCCVYIPSGSNVATYQRYGEAFEKILNYLDLGTEDELWVFGDFNLPHVDWLHQSCAEGSVTGSDNLFVDGNVLIPTNLGDSTRADLLHVLLSADLHQVNDVVNADGRILDLIFTSNPFDVEVKRSLCPMSKIDPYHEPIEVAIPVKKMSKVVPRRCEEFNYAKADWSSLNSHLSSIDWSARLERVDDVNDAVTIFYDVLLSGLKSFVPFKRNVPSKHPPWYNKKVKSLKNRRNKAHRQFKSTGSRSDELTFYAVRREFESAQEGAYQRYLEDTQRDLICDPSKFWHYVKSRRDTTGYPSMMSFDGDKSSEPNVICRYFADFFKSVYVDDGADATPGVPVSGVSVRTEDSRAEVMSIDMDTLLDSLESVDTSKGNGPDDISPMLLKVCSVGLAPPLHRIFNLSLSTESFPTRWKKSYVKPIFKSGSRSDVRNYRGVAILPTFGKLFESIVCHLISDRMSTFISSVQHGFMKGRSVTTNLLEFANMAMNVLESGSQLDVIYTDFQKAFDKVSHLVLLKKLQDIGVEPKLLGWIASYLNGRLQYVKLSGHVSAEFESKSGVPQGSHLGPLLFILFMDDVTRVLKSIKLLYADDLKLIGKVKSISDAILLQADLNALTSWCRENRLYLNVDKCKVMSFFRIRAPVHFDYCIDGVPLTRVKEIRDLGVLLDERLTFNRHVDFVTSKSYSMLGFVKRICRNFKNVRALKSVYFAHVRSHLECASVVWHPHQFVHISRIESIQKKFLMYALRSTVRRDQYHRLPPYLERCKSIGIEPLWRRRVNLNVLFVFDLLRGRVSAPELMSRVQLKIPARTFRGSEFFVIDYHRTEYGQHEPLNSVLRMFNAFSHLYDPSVSREVFRNKVGAMSLPASFCDRFGLSAFCEING